MMVARIQIGAFLGASILGVSLIGCKASVQGDVKSGASARAEGPDPFASLNDPEPTHRGDSEESELTDLDNSLRGDKPTLALLGARHDVQLQPRSKPSCSCMAFAAGDPTDRRFVWEDTPPVVANTNSTVVAFAMVEGECSSDIAVSYRGYELAGADVRILLEAAVPGRPLLSGAVVPAPQPGGHFVIAPPKDAPFGRSRVAGETQCVLQEGQGAALADPGASPISTEPTAEDAPSNEKRLRRTNVEAQAPDEDVPTSEEFASTPNDIPLDDGEHSDRSGFHLSMVLGAEYPIGRISVGNGLNAGSLTALGAGFDLFLGGNQKPGMAVGFTIGGASAPDPEFGFDAVQIETAQSLGDQGGWELSGSSLVLQGMRLNLFRVGAFVDYYFTEDSNWHGLLTLGYASVSFSGGPATESGQGFALQGGIGYDLWLSHDWSIGLLGRLMWAPMSVASQDVLVHFYSPNLGINGTFH